MPSFTHRRLQLHRPRLPDPVLAGVQVQALVLKDLALAHDVAHLAVKEDLIETERHALLRRFRSFRLTHLHWSDQRLVAVPDVVSLCLAQALLGLANANQGSTCIGNR